MCLHLYSHPLLSIHALSFLPLPPTDNSNVGSGSGVTKPKLLCSVEGATYSECGAACPLTCLTPAILCLIQGCFPGCTCPDGQLIDEVNNRCVPLEQCPPLGTCFYSWLITHVIWSLIPVVHNAGRETERERERERERVCMIFVGMANTDWMTCAHTSRIILAQTY